MTLAEFNPTAEITHSVHVAKTLGNYDINIGQDLLHELGIDIIFSTKTMRWNEVEVDMKKNTCMKEDLFHVEEELFVLDKTDRIAKILDAKYKPVNLKKLTTNLPQSNTNQQEKLYGCLNNCATLFDSMLGLWKGDLYK